MMKFRSQVVLAISLLWIAMSAPGCSKPGQAPRTAVLDRISDQIPQGSGSSSTIRYVASFASEAEAQAHAAAIRAEGGQVTLLDKSGRSQSVAATREQLTGATIPNSALVSADTEVRAVPGSAPATEDPEQLFESLLTARKVVGVEQLLARFPQADGRGLKVAVFDTGIDFGLEGVFKQADGSQKLVGFYDLTGFGKVSPSRLESEAPQTSYTISGKSVRFDADVAPAKVQSTGLLDEKELAKAYLVSEIDLRQDDKSDEQFPFAVGVNSAGKPAVWLDSNRDGSFSRGEELTDFNTTYKYLDMRTDVAPSGARALAVTINSATDIQFHAVFHGHGTSCSMIIAGDGYADHKLKGMAPKAQLLGYLLDTTGNDVYTMDQLMRMFLHAKAQGVNAISISYGFSTADLASARFLADFLDKEIASSGILIGMAAGNDGPGIGSVPYDDYIPHHGFAVGAMVSQEQARGVYGWNGAVEDSIVFYSGIGPTRGGRQVPDISSPLMTWVRGQRGTDAGPFYAFSGTSSATPALVGATTALQSALKQSGEDPIDMRLLKLALQNSARTLDHVERIRQGSGVLNVSAAYDLYKKLAAEERAARADAAHRTPFAYELQASTPLEKRVETGEGVRFHGFKPTALVKVTLSKASAELVDPLVLMEPLRVEHSLDFFAANPLLKLQGPGATLGLQFDAAALAKPGVYADLIQLRRPSDGLVLLQIPVVVEIAPRATQQGILASVSQDLGPLEIARLPFHLDEATPVVFDGLLHQVSDGGPLTLGIMIQNSTGDLVVKLRKSMERSFMPVSLRTPSLAPGDYQILLYPGFAQPSTLVPLHIEGAFRLPSAKAVATELTGDGKLKAIVQASSAGSVTYAQAVLKLTSARLRGVLERNGAEAARPGFETELDLGREAQALGLGLRQTAFDRATHDGLAMEVSVIDSVTGMTLDREWVNFTSRGDGLQILALSAPATKVRILAYPNIVQWDQFSSRRIPIEASVALGEKPVTAEFKPKNPVTIQALQTSEIDFDLPAATSLPASCEGMIELRDAAGAPVETVGFGVSR